MGVILLGGSAFMRNLLRKFLAEEKLSVGEATSEAAMMRLANNPPDLVIMDVDAEGIEGFAMLERLSGSLPKTRFIALTHPEIPSMEEALNRGAYAAVGKPSSSKGSVEKFKDVLLQALQPEEEPTPQPEAEVASPEVSGPAAPEQVEKIQQHPAEVQTPQDSAPQESPDSASSPAQPSADAQAGQKPEKAECSTPAKKIVVIGASTGGPDAIRRIAPFLPGNLPAAILVVQEIPSKFTKILLDHLLLQLGKSTEMKLGIAQDGAVLCEGQIIFAPEGRHVALERRGDSFALSTRPLPNGDSRIDSIMNSVAENCGENCIGVILTGEGVDGAEGLISIKRFGGKTLVQDPTWSCTSPQLPKHASNVSQPDYILKLDEIPRKIIELLTGGING